MNGYPTNYLTAKPSARLDKRLKAVIGYWTDYYYTKTDTTVTFSINNQKVTVSYDSPYYEIHYKWLTTPVHQLDIFDTLDLYEDMLKAMN